ncbi:DUF4270 domain-containing protein [Flavobacterium sp. CBA20B-1]|uniref:DUF4270 domain-containing protein n=1 Tax=unclassified Flavobacterium TaxID=196869 RepID=UPI0022248A06|nr:MULTISPECIES: DUF4270 domain-containing protein [unclassified Flavobacterium]WCM41027.1 DUF4270 domain-containing protein [Flavobacterium sp. CBA20B-1]
MRRKSIAQFVVLSVLSVTAISCEQDFTEMGAEVIDSDQFGFEKYLVQNIETTNSEAGIANTRNLPVNNLGVYTHSAFGKTTAHFVTQIEMKNNSDLTSFGENLVLDSVYVYIPFTSSVSATDSDGNRSFNVSDVYGNGKFTLNVYENGYFLRTTDPNNNFDTQFYYADEKNIFDQNKKGLAGSNRLNNSTNTAQNTEFAFNKNEIKLYAYNADGTPQMVDGKQKVKERLAPGVWLDLDKNYFQEKFFANNKYKSLLNNGLLKEYFRGLYFEVEDNFSQNALAQLNLSRGKVVFVYKQDGEIDANTNQPKRERKTYEFRIGYDDKQSTPITATTVNLLENNFDLDNNSVGNLWIKGGGNSTFATLSLFGNDADGSGKADELETIINNKWLVNQALLTLYVDHSAMGLDTIAVPKQLYLYDYKNNKVIADYLSDTSTTGKPIFGGFLNKTNKSVHKYQFRITDHINNLITKDSTNVPLGLVVASDISLTAMNPLKATTKTIPLTATMNPFGTIIHGPNASNSDLKMRLEIYYTKEN